MTVLWISILPSQISHNYAQLVQDVSDRCLIANPSWGKVWGGLIQALRWRHNDRDGVSNRQCLNCLLSHLFRRRSKKTSKLHFTDLREGNLPVTGGFPSQGPVKCFPLMTSSWLHEFTDLLSAGVMQHCLSLQSWWWYLGFSGSGIQCAIPVVGMPVNIFCPNISCLLFGVNKVFSKNLPLGIGHDIFCPLPAPHTQPPSPPDFCIHFIYWPRWYTRVFPLWHSTVLWRDPYSSMSMA